MNTGRALRFIKDRGVVLESARDRAVVNLADEVLGKHRRGSWWGHARGNEFFSLTRQIRSSTDVLVCHLIGGKVTYVHRRLWPTLLRLSRVLGARRLAAIREVHTDSGAHRVYRTPFQRWVTARVRAQAAKLTSAQARQQLGAAIVSATQPRRAY